MHVDLCNLIKGQGIENIFMNCSYSVTSEKKIKLRNLRMQINTMTRQQNELLYAQEDGKLIFVEVWVEYTGFMWLLVPLQIRPVVDKVFSFTETPKAYRYVMEGHARGKTVISIP